MALSNVRSVSVGGNIKMTVADYSTTGDAAGTDSIGVAGTPIVVIAQAYDSTGAILPGVSPRSSFTTSGNVSTVTIYSQEAVTTGKLCIIHA